MRQPGTNAQAFQAQGYRRSLLRQLWQRQHLYNDEANGLRLTSREGQAAQTICQHHLDTHFHMFPRATIVTSPHSTEAL